MQLVGTHGFDITVSGVLSLLVNDYPRLHIVPGDDQLPCDAWLPDLYREHYCARPQRGLTLRLVK